MIYLSIKEINENVLKPTFKLKALRLPLAFFSVLLLIFIARFNEVNSDISEEDTQYIPNYLNLPRTDANISYEEELELISKIQDAVLTVAPLKDNDLGIALGRTREPKDLWEEAHGLCSDRSRVIEKILVFHGFKTRHISAYFVDGDTTPMEALLTPGSPSHALTEVKTKKGWLLVAPNHRWLSIDENQNPVSIAMVKRANDVGRKVKWARGKPADDIYYRKFVYLYGLYSRHGYFYPPFNIVPDINWNEFSDNIFSE